jgi:DNA polymerase-3 subunit alpha
MIAKLKEICEQAMLEKGLVEEKFKSRLDYELAEINKLNESNYFLDLYSRKARFRTNENNLLVAYLLGVVDEIDINRDADHTVPEWPDIDTDFIKPIRPFLKEEYIPEKFGREKCCSIANYNTYGIKSVLLDTTRVFGGDRNELLKITKTLGTKDDEGESLSWEKAIEIYPELKKWVGENKEIAEVSRKILTADIDWAKYGYKGEPPHRTKSLSRHAGGLIIAENPVSDMVPLVCKDGQRASAWTEGLHDQDLSLFGYVKFDFLIVDALLTIGLCIKLIRERHKDVHKICALPNGRNFSDTSYLNDKKCLEVANRGDLKMIFQFDSEGIRELARSCTVTSFDDVVAITSLYRPSALSMKMHEAYSRRKKGEEEYDRHPLLEPIIGDTYYVLCYQEQVMQVLNVVGLIPMKDCQPIIKAISKKNKSKFEKYKDLFVKNARVTLSLTEDGAVRLWDQIEAFAGYAFNKSHAVAYSYLTMRQLYLKTYYPIEYVTASLSCLKTGDDSLLEYKLDAERHGVRIEKADINKSDYNFTIVDEKIYWGISKIKGLGNKVATKLMENRPYRDFADFINKFGTDGSAIKPILGVRLFKDADPISLYKYYLGFKDVEKKVRSRDKRYVVNKEKVLDKVEKLLGYRYGNISWEELEARAKEKDCVEEFLKLKKKYETVVFNYERGLDSKKYSVTDDYEFDEEEMKTELLKNLTDSDYAEKTYYGFMWNHPIRKIKDYGGFTFEDHRMEISNNTVCSPVEVIIEKVHHNTSKKGTSYYQLEVEDANFEKQRVNVWKKRWTI